eukprot:8343877-Ditylum_brightwellii.AAC.1
MEETAWDQVGTALTSQKLQTTDAVADCPACCAEKETWTHMFQYPHKDTVAIHTMALTKFRLALIAMKTAPIIRQVLCYKMGQWCKLLCGDIPQILADTTEEILCSAVELQAQIGWEVFTQGHVTKQWSQAQKVTGMLYQQLQPLTVISGQQN